VIEDIAYDVEGYHAVSHDREASDATVHPAEASEQHMFPSSSGGCRTTHLYQVLDT
jgi:hypothetical protein